MSKRNYRNLEEEQSVEMRGTTDNIPIGQPVPPYYQQEQPQFQRQPEVYPGQQVQMAPMHPPMHHQPMHHQPMHHQPMPYPQQMQPPPAFQQVPPVAAMSTQAYNYPTAMTCPCCKNQVTSVVNLQSGNTTYMWCVAITCFCSNFCCLPFLMEACLDKSHYCPNCGHNILRKHQKCFEFMGC